MRFGSPAASTAILISVANLLKDHCIQKRFAADPIAQRVLPMLGDEDFFEQRPSP